MRTSIIAVIGLLALSACGSTPQRAAMPDVASTDQSADEMGLPSVEEAPSASGSSGDGATAEGISGESPSPESADSPSGKGFAARR